MHSVQLNDSVFRVQSNMWRLASGFTYLSKIMCFLKLFIPFSSSVSDVHCWGLSWFVCNSCCYQDPDKQITRGARVKPKDLMITKSKNWCGNRKYNLFMVGDSYLVMLLMFPLCHQPFFAPSVSLPRPFTPVLSGVRWPIDNRRQVAYW